MRHGNTDASVALLLSKYSVYPYLQSARLPARELVSQVLTLLPSMERIAICSIVGCIGVTTTLGSVGTVSHLRAKVEHRFFLASARWSAATRHHFVDEVHHNHGPEGKAAGRGGGS